MDHRLLNWPGKSATEAPWEHPAVYHMLDVAAVAEQLLKPSPFPDALKAAFTFLIALHDLGKIGNGFRNMIRSGIRQQQSHWVLTEAWLIPNVDLQDRLAANDRVWFALVGAIAGHHGHPSQEHIERFFTFRKMAGEEAIRDVPAIIDGFLALWPNASLAELNRASAQRLSWWLSGLTVAADWVGSNADWFPPHPPDLNLPDYLAQTQIRAKAAVQKAGLQTPSLRQRTLFDFTLRPMQQAANDVSLPDGPMLAFIEDETGAGKTEAAMILAQRMLAAGKGRGLYIALPTMATADAMFARAEKFMGRMFETLSLTLAHGRAALSKQFHDLSRRFTLNREDANDVTCTPWLADNRRRALLANVGIGTIDQALLAVMPTRFSTLRLWGLASKILIVDEAHEISGDHYMAELLTTLLRIHAAQGGSAILLTATLPLEHRVKFTRAFAEGAGQEWPDDHNRHYPSLSIPGGEARRDFDQAPGLKGPVRVARLSSTDEAIDLLSAATAQGAACVWVRNAVDEAMDAMEALRARGNLVSLLHARFTLCDRKRIENAELARFGHDGTGREGRILVATQIVESSLDLDFDVMVSDLAPVAALIQRAGRLWRHMDKRPRNSRAVPEPVLHVLSPDPAAVLDADWLKQVLGHGAFVYPVADQWRTAETLFRTGVIEAPGGLRDLIEAVRAETIPLPAPLEAAETERRGLGYAEANLASHNLIEFEKGYRAGGAGADDAKFPTRLGRPKRTLVLARRQKGGLKPWAVECGNGEAEEWMLSEVQADKQRLDCLPLPDQAAPEIAVVTQGWPDWRRKTVTLCPVGEDRAICEGLRYDADLGLLF